MRKLLKKIFEDVIYYEEEVINIDKEINEKIEKYIKPYSYKLTPEEIEGLKTTLYKISFESEEIGFYLGVKYSVKLINDFGIK